MTELKGCPLCGGVAVILSERDGEYIECSACELRLTIGDRAEGVERWNSRCEEAT